MILARPLQDQEHNRASLKGSILKPEDEIMKSWKIFSIAGLAAAGIALWSGMGQAQYLGPNLYQRGAIQEQQIKEGILTGALTPQEAERLAAEQRRLRAAEARLRADGRLDPRELAFLERKQAKAGKHIYQQIHDHQAVYPGYRNHPEPRYQHWQEKNRRHHRQENHYRRELGCDRGGAFQPGPGGKPFGGQNRHPRFAWGR
jgi:hypothetical protein